MPDAPVLVSDPRGGSLHPSRLALRAAGQEATSAWTPRAALAGFELELEPRLEAGGAAAELGVRVRNASPEPRRFEAVELDFRWECAEARVADALSCGEVALARGASDRLRALVGVLASDRCLGRVSARGGRGAEFAVELHVGAVFEAGESRALDAVALAVGDADRALLEDFAGRWGAACEARTWRPAPLSWRLGDGVEAALPRALDALRALRDRLPVEAVLLPEDFRGGLEAAAEAVRAAGLVPGLEVAPLRDAPDASRDETFAALEARFRAWHERGFFLYALHGLEARPGARAADVSLGPAAQLRRALEAVRRGASDEAFLLAADGAWGPAVGVVDARLHAAPPGLEAWTHRRLWVAAADAPCAAPSGAMLVLRGAPQELAPAERERWSEAARREDPDSAAPADPPSLAVFCDFDGTFSVQDVGATLAQRHGGERRPREWARYERGEITPWEYNLAILDGLPVGTEALEEFLASVELDPGAAALLGWCGARGVPFRILSDGFDWNLNRLQVLHGVRFAYTANRLRIEHGRWRIAAGAPDPSCGCGTGTCKAAALRAHRARHPGVHLVHIGNGRVSDSCGAVEADTAFAKDSLAEALARRGEPFVRFQTLRDVIPHLERILDAASGRQALGKAPATR